MTDTLEYEVHAQEAAGSSADYKEGLAAFIEKRTPNYIGK
jgi:2-(1,2-epoxy-1,2-dihydrophenyl)acetyl-CoA isomerase